MARGVARGGPELLGTEALGGARGRNFGRGIGIVDTLVRDRGIGSCLDTFPTSGTGVTGVTDVRVDGGWCLGSEVGVVSRVAGQNLGAFGWRSVRARWRWVREGVQSLKVGWSLMRVSRSAVVWWRVSRSRVWCLMRVSRSRSRVSDGGPESGV